MTGYAGHTVIVERPFHVRILRQRSGKKRCWVVTRFAVTREFDPSLILQVFDVLLIERLAKSIPGRRFPPPRMRLCVRRATAFGRDEHIARNEWGGCGGCVGWRRTDWDE